MRLRGPLVLAGIAASIAAPSAHAATFTVSGTDDSSSGNCDASDVCTNLRIALTEASRIAGPDVIRLAGLTYNVTVGQLPVTSEVTVAGASAATTAIRGGGKTRVFDVAGGQKFTVQHATISNGVAEAANDIGGDVRAQTGAQLVLDHVRVTAGASFGGGGIGLMGGVSAQITQSLIDGTTTVNPVGGVGPGGALLLAGDAKAASGISLSMSDSTVTGNGPGGGIVAGGDVRSKTTLTRTTIASNSRSGNGAGAGIAVADAESFKVTGSIVSGNTGDGTPDNCSGTLTSGGGNIDSAQSCGLATSSDKQNTDPGLQPLQSGLGETPVLPILALSPAVDFIPIGAAACTGTDQRDLARPQGNGCDSGAFEFDQPPDTSIDSGPTGTIAVNSATFTFSSTEPGVGFQCRLDRPSGQGTYAACTTPQAYGGLADGAYTFFVRALDRAGQMDASPPSRPFTVDTTPPKAPTITTPASDTLQKTTSVTLGGSTDAGSTVEVFDGTTSKGQATVTGTTWSLAISGLADGAHPYTAKAKDAVGNTSAASNTRTITVDTIAPAAPAITTPAADKLQNTTSITLGGTTAAGTTIEVFDNGASKGAATVTGTTWTITISGLAEGAHPYTAKAMDAAGNVSGASNTRTITVDTTPPAALAITTPSADTVQNTRTVTLGGTTATGTTIEVFDNGGSKGNATVTGTTWTITLNNVGDGAHPYTAKATDPAGNVSGASNTRTITIDTSAPNPPAITTPAGDALQKTTSVTLGGATVSGTTVEVFDGSASKGAATVSGTTWTITIGGLADGAHAYTAKAKDAAGNTSGASNTRTITVDTTPPPADVVSGPSGPTSDSAPSFVFQSSDGGATFECRLDGPGAAVGTYRGCTSPDGFSSLAAGDYTFSVRATDTAGNQTVTSRSFSVIVPQQATPTPTPTPGPAQPPQPQAGKTVVIQPVSGQTLIKEPGSSKFVPVDATRGIPLGSIVDTRHSKIRLFAIPKAGEPPQSALFFGGLFKVTQSGGVTQLQLVEQLACAKAGKASVAAKKPKTRKLWGDGSGSFRTRGQYSAATVRGTKWLVQDSCTTTLTRVAKGVVSVQDFVKHKTVLVRAPRRYTARKR